MQRHYLLLIKVIQWPSPNIFWVHKLIGRSFKNNQKGKRTLAALEQTAFILWWKINQGPRLWKTSFLYLVYHWKIKKLQPSFCRIQKYGKYCHENVLLKISKPNQSTRKGKICPQTNLQRFLIKNQTFCPFQCQRIQRQTLSRVQRKNLKNPQQRLHTRIRSARKAIFWANRSLWKWNPSQKAQGKKHRQ